MKRLLVLSVGMFLSMVSYAQYSITGQVMNAEANAPAEGVTITLLKQGKNISIQNSAYDGNFKFNNLKNAGEYQLRFQHISLRDTSVHIIVSGALTIVNISMKQNSYFLEPLEVRSIRASDKAPFVKTNLTREDIQKNNIGQDLPFLLNQTPGVVINSDAGNGIGYTGIRIRGSDASRINVTINGIPYNDAESQGTYFVDLPDVASSINSIQIQRGVGTSSNGAGAFGASLNLSTNEFNKEAYGESNNSYGSFNSWKNTVKAGSGLINKHFLVDTRLSRISSDGFIDRASSNLRSLYLSTAYISDKSSLRFNFFSGHEKTYQAWNGVPENMLQTNRTFNSAGTEKPGEPYNNETDNYQQDHYQLFFNHAFSKRVSFNTAFFLSNGKGYYEQYKADQSFARYGLSNPMVNGAEVASTDLVRQLWLNNHFFGQIFSFQAKNPLDEITFGGGWNRYIGGHHGNIIWAQTGIPKDYEWYLLDAYKTDVNVYSKWQHSISNRFNIYTDLQYRMVQYDMNGFRNNPTVIVRRNFNFVNPKAGVSYDYRGLQAFFSYALGNKEPNRDDFEAGVNQQPRHETLHDFEVGVEKKYRNAGWGATTYYMLYKNQLILTGQINDVGAYTRENVPNSYRLGLELQGHAKLAKFANIAANLSVSRNKIKASEEYVDDYDNGGQKKIQHNNTNISFSPSLVGGGTLNLLPFRNGEISLISKYVGRQYLDNTETLSRSLNPYYIQDIRFSYTLNNKVFKKVSFIASVYNVFNKKYEPNGYTFSYIYGGKTTTENYYFPMAGTNFMGGINISF